eukprot:TRINITY_DN9106_c0_g1_i2.p1 TRINITY_DN9106_c0_g1~~TRINITY_DN9106_c0_g1_i2.p1  ORF type:complete len:365 (-),score=59.55 TRINITY_DN9106_c0_g1_i2:139-1233(-)
MDAQKKKEYCEILGVPIDANEATVKKAYYKLAMELHPDRPHNKGKEGIEKEFQRVAEAYEKICSGNSALNNLKKNFKSQDIHSSLAHFFFTTKTSVTDLTALTSTTRVGPTPKKGQTLQTSLQLTFLESTTGCTKILEYNTTTTCPTCLGQGTISSPPRTRNVECKDCGGNRVISAQLGSTIVSTPCTSCPREDVRRVCNVCAGSARVNIRKTKTVVVPIGVYSGMTLTYPGEGDEGTDGGARGDFIISFSVDEDPFFKRQGEDVQVQTSISFPIAALGGIIQVPALGGGTFAVQVPPGTEHMQVIRVPKMGFYNPLDNNIRGDMLLRVCIHMPKALSDKERKLLQKLSQLSGFSSGLEVSLKR